MRGGSTHLGHYRLGERIGSGGMGVVYRAWDELLERWVAIKIIPPDKREDRVRRERLRREARASARLTHPAIVRIFDLLVTEEADAIVMELVEGTSLARVLRDGPLDLPRVFSLGRAIAEALDEAHSHGIVHRDLKTENVVLTLSEYPKILDFGLAKEIDALDSSLTLEGRVLGTCRSMAPEQAEGREVDHRADLFAFGTLLYEILTAHSPFLDHSAAATLHRVCTLRQAPARTINRWIPAELSDLVDHLLEKDPELRPRHARDVASRLGRIAAEAQISFSQDDTGWESAGADTLAEPLRVPVPQATPAPPPPRATAERRQVTVLLGAPIRPDGGPLDPEEILSGMQSLQTTMTRIVERFGGHLGPARDFGWPAWFGYPRAHEDDACRAVRAARAVVEQARLLCPVSGCVIAEMRIGLHTGSMILGRTGNEPVALGDAPNVAAGVQAFAPPGGVLVSQATWHLVESFFEAEELPALLPLGPRPTPLFRILADRGAHSRFAAGGALTPLVAREQELGLLLEQWEHTRDGRGRVVLLSGEAGIGKSRLIWELRRRIADASGGWLEGHALPDQHDNALHPVLPVVRQLGDLPGRTEAVDPSPLAAHRKTLESIVALVLTAAEKQPLALVVEDLHWADPSTLELLDLLIRHLAGVPLLLLLTTRPELQHRWEAGAKLTQLTLAPLSSSQAHQLVERLTAGHPLDAPRIEQIVARTDGLPLFVEELTRVVVDAGLSDAAPLPSSLEGWLLARLDRLDGVRELALVAAAIGREVSWELLREVAEWNEEELRHGLDRLVEAEILQRRGLPPRTRYRFRHSLLQDAAYASLLRSDRRHLHARIAQILESRFTDLAEGRPERVAHHFTEAGLAEHAAIWWLRAGEHALRTSACREALGPLQKALAALHSLPDSRERDQREVAVQVARGTAAAALQSYALPAVREAFARAWELCRRSGPASSTFTILQGLYLHALIGGDLAAARETTIQLLAIAREEKAPALLVTAHQATGFVRLLRGNLSSTRLHLERSLAFGAPTLSPADLLEPGVGFPALNALANLSWAHQLLGEHDQAAARAAEVAELAGTLTVPPISRCFLQYSLAELAALRRDPAGVEAQAGLLVPLAVEQGFQMFESMGRFLLAWAHHEHGDGTDAIEVMRRSLTTRRELLAHIGLPHHHALLAGAYLRADRIVEGLATLKEALALQGDQKLVEPELHRLQGELLHRHGVPGAEAETHLTKALDVARHQGARALALRAAVSLARLRLRQGRAHDGYAVLAPVYAGFRGLRHTGPARSEGGAGGNGGGLLYLPVIAATSSFKRRS